jgi:flagellar biosynthetic protein FliR
MLALAVHVAFSTFSVAGSLLDVQIGFGMSQVLDPTTNRQSSALTAVFNQVGVLVFFLLNGHHALLRGVVYSLQHFPLGAPWALTNTFTPLFRQATGLFTLAVALAAPVMLCIMMVELAVGVIGRNLPQMNMFTIGIPAKLVVGLVALALWATGIGNAMSQVYGSIYHTWDAIFSDAALAPMPMKGSGA